jgi:hypothetical protein
MAFWSSAYRFYALVDAVTAILTVASALTLFYFVPIFAQPRSLVLSSGDHENTSRALALKDREICDLHETVGMLCKQMDSLERIQRSGQWFANQQRLLEQVRSRIDHDPT